jgi:hypothetical protein
MPSAIWGAVSAEAAMPTSRQRSQPMAVQKVPRREERLRAKASRKALAAQ